MVLQYTNGAILGQLVTIIVHRVIASCIDPIGSHERVTPCQVPRAVYHKPIHSPHKEEIPYFGTRRFQTLG